MRPTDTNPASVPPGVFLLLRDLISERLGVWFEEDKRDLLAAKLQERIAALAKLITARPEDRIAVVGHGDFFRRLIGRHLANCERAEWDLNSARELLQA